MALLSTCEICLENSDCARSPPSKRFNEKGNVMAVFDATPRCEPSAFVLSGLANAGYPFQTWPYSGSFLQHPVLIY